MRSVQVGEDSYFLRPDSIGIADGVGGWATRPGANPAMFSRLLMHFCSVELSRFDWRHEHLDPVEVMHRAWERCVRVARREGILGSTTALLALLRKDELRIANLGDCVLLIVRKGELLFRSQEQQHSFNFPVQLGMMPRRDCGRWTIKVQKGDIIIVASDGLVDNLFDDDIIEEVQRFAPPPSSPDEALASRAKAISQDAKAIVSPFQQRATEEGLHYVGGKHDDISVLVAVVGEAAAGGGGGGGGGAAGADGGEGAEGGGGLELRAR
ncbi:protein serine/threonine phosphatase 2C [Microstroma glucosiphilum]|uniref:Protein phosphatase n=1 Tax=Pseudomicrostroma glucosiphilum TaxID=1684307 RepID=A0A316UEB1_9BASI|nr:protein serine/threonine phosphatase 2C [Pseudomicrostroma glucosiphilum]PWN23532.1 protein serine/threonine phosphatase 2C [Pseudomicrostroma glucosiphilum]